MKDVLEYTEDELRGLSVDELKLLEREAESKESLFNTRQLVEKTLINGLYGAMANQYFPLFNEDMAAAITGNGRFFIQKLAQYIEDGLQKILPWEKPYITYGDTDSVYYTIAPFMDKYQAKNPDLSINEYVDWADKFEIEVIQPIITKTVEDFSEELNAYNREKIGVEREIISDATVFVAKKKYYARVRDSEGTRYAEDDPYIKKMGLEVIKSSTPIWSKKYLTEAIPHILDKNESELRDWVNEIKQNYVATDLGDLAMVGGVSRMDYVLGEKSVPFGSRAALVHNKYIEDNELTGQYAPIQAGDKTKRIFLITPNKFDSNIIAFTNDSFPKEIGPVCDYDMNFEKSFLNPLNLMIAPLNYDLQKETEDLDDW